MLWLATFQAIAAAATFCVAVLALSNWHRQLRNQTADKCLSDAKLYEGALNRYVELRCNDNVSHEDKVAAYDQVWMSLRNLMASYEVVRRYKIAVLTDDIGAECKRGIDKVPLLPKAHAPGAKDGEHGANAKNETKQIIDGLTAKLGEPYKFLGVWR